MCGICGIFEHNKDNRNLMPEMLELIKHRGPDNQTVFSHKNITLGHARLSIIDLDTGDQPIFNEDKSLAVIFNGEIYNYLYFKEILQKKGHDFKTNSDTEILVHAYEEFGTEFFKDLNGIFSFCIYDFRKDNLILVRDHFGIKPLHYYYKNGIFIFGSEQKSILLHPKVERKMSVESLHYHLNLRYTQNTETMFENIFRLEPGHFLKFENNNIHIERYYQLPFKLNRSLSENEIIEQSEHLLKDSIKKQLMSDVPVGVYLSGGMDSSTIVQKISELGVSKINTFTLGFNEPTDEFPDANSVTEMFGTNHKTLSLQMEPLSLFPNVIWHAEEPKINLLQGFNLSKFVSKDVKVILGGLGGDELFAGYDIHKILYNFSKVNSAIPSFLNKLRKSTSNILFNIQNTTGNLKFDEYRRGFQSILSPDLIEQYLITRNVWDFNNEMYKNIYSESFLFKNKMKQFRTITKFDEFNLLTNYRMEQIFYTEIHTKMINDYLLVEDRMSMAHSVEERVPFLDKDFVEFMVSIPFDKKFKKNETKHLFRNMMQKKLPESIINKKKWGFAVNPYLQFKKDLKSTAEKILTKDFIKSQGIFNYTYIKKILNSPAHPNLRWHYNLIWIILGIAIWEKMFVRTDLFVKKEFVLEEFYNV